MNLQSVRQIIIALIGHGFSRSDLMSMSHAELKWWYDGYVDFKKAEAQAKAAAIKRGRSKNQHRTAS